MLYKLAWKAKTPRFSYEEAQSEAFLAFMLACYSYDPGRGALFSSWCYFKVWTHLKSHKAKLAKDRLVFMELNEELVGAVPACRRIFLEMLDDLSGDAREMISLMTNPPKEVLASSPLTPQELLESVFEHLGFSRGFDQIYNEITLHEIQMRFQELRDRLDPRGRAAGRPFAQHCLRRSEERKEIISHCRRSAREGRALPLGVTVSKQKRSRARA